MSNFNQKTIAREVFKEGIGLFTGEKVSIKLVPAPENHGIVLQRVDLAHHPRILATLQNVKDTPRCTRIGNDNCSIQMVEHLMAAIYSAGIDNLLIQVHGPEIISGDGSSDVFVSMIEDAQVITCNKPKKKLEIIKPVFYTNDLVQIVALPSEDFKISYTLDCPESELIGSQFYSLKIDFETFKEQIARSRTFSVYEEVFPFIEKGYIKGASLENAVVIKQNKVQNTDGLRFKNEMVRHKILDLIGDLALIGRDIKGHIISIRSGHATNIAFAKLLLNEIK